MLPNLIGTSHMIWLEAILPLGVDIIYDPLVWRKSNPSLAPNFAPMKQCDAPESNNITTGLLWIENIPVITGATSGSSANEVKLSFACFIWTFCFLPLFFLFFPEPWPGLGCLTWEHSRVRWFGSPQFKQWLVLLRRRGDEALSLGPLCWAVGGIARSDCSGGLKTHHPYWGALWGTWSVSVRTNRYICDAALEGPVGAFLFFSAWCAMI